MTKKVETAKDAIVRNLLRFDDLVKGVEALREYATPGDADEVNWGHVGSLAHVNDLLEEALAHYGLR